jgi:ABC-type multidrug transport system fused ATPase/permease subunit
LSIGDCSPDTSETTLSLALSIGFGIGLARMQDVIVDRAFFPGDCRTLPTSVAVLLFAFVVVSVASLRQAYLMAWVSGMVPRGISRRMLSVVQWQHPGSFQQKQTGDIMSRTINDLGQVQFALTGAIAQGHRVILTLLAAIAVLLVEDWRLILLGGRYAWMWQQQARPDQTSALRIAQSTVAT